MVSTFTPLYWVVGYHPTVRRAETKTEGKASYTRRNKVRLRGKGYDRGDGTFGDLIITYNVKLPDHLTDRQKELIEQMRREG